MKKLLFLTGGLLLASASPSFAWSNNCVGSVCAQAASDKGPAQAQQQGQAQGQLQLQGQGQNQGQTLNNQNKLSNKAVGVGVGVGYGGAGGQGGAGGNAQGGQGGIGQGGAGGSVTGGNVSSSNTNRNSNQNTNDNSNENTNTNNSSAYNGGQSNSQSTTFAAGSYAPDAISNAPGFGVSVGIGVCAGQESHSGGGGVGVGVLGGPSIGVSGEYGDATMVENHQCDYRAHVSIFCNLPPTHMINGVPAGYICDSILARLDGAGDAINAWNDAHAPKQTASVAAAPVKTAAAKPPKPARCFSELGTAWYAAHCQ